MEQGLSVLPSFSDLGLVRIHVQFIAQKGEMLVYAPPKRLQFLAANVLGRLEIFLWSAFAFPWQSLACYYPPFGSAYHGGETSGTLEWLCALMEPVYYIWWISSSETCFSESLRILEHTLCLLLAGITGISHDHCSYSSYSVRSYFENKKCGIIKIKNCYEPFQTQVPFLRSNLIQSRNSSMELLTEALDLSKKV